MLVEAAGVKLHVAHHAGSPERTPLVLLHGFTQSSSTWRPLLPDLSEHARTVALDLVGYGRSEAPADPARYTLDAHVAQVLAVCDALGIEQADWLGYSLGGRVALGVALAAPHRVRRLVLESAGPGIAGEGERAARRASDEAFAQLAEKDLPAFVERWMAQPLFASQQRLGAAWLAEQRAERSRAKPRGVAMSLRGLGQGSAPAMQARLREVRCPTLLVSGALDAAYGATMDAMAKEMPAAQRAIVEDAGHCAHAEKPAAFLRVVLAFLAAA